MSKDLHEAIKLLRDMAPIIDPEEDFLTILAAEEQIATTEAKRKKELEDLHAKVKAHAKVLESARKSSARPQSVLSADAHAAAINQLDVTRLSLCKSISDAEDLLANKEAELTSLKEETAGLEECDPAGDHELDLDGAALRLRIYKGMGFEPVLDNNGVVSKMLVRSRSGDVHCVEFDDQKSRFEYAELLWKLASS